MKVLVTGASGFLGKHIVRKLLDENYEVIAISLTDLNSQHPRLKLIICDLNDINEIVYEKNIEAVIHTAACINLNDNDEAIAQITKDNIMASIQLSNFIIHNNINKVIVSSTGSVYEGNYIIGNQITESSQMRPLNLYAVSKLASEWIFENKLSGYTEELVFLRYSSIYGHGQRTNSIIPIFIRNAILSQSIEVYGSGNRVQDYIYIEDAVQANMKCLKLSLPFSSIFNIGSGEPISDKELAENVKRIWNSRSQILVGNTSNNHESYFQYSINKAKTILDFSPLNLSEGLKKYCELTKE